MEDYLSQDSVHAIKYKFVANNYLKKYIDNVSEFANYFAEFFKGTLVSPNPLLKEFGEIVLQADSNVVGHIVSFLVKQQSEYDQDAPTFKKIKSIASKLRNSKVFPLDVRCHLVGVRSAEHRKVSVQALLCGYQAVKSWMKCNEITKENYQVWENQIKSMEVEEVTYSKFLSWVKHCEEKKYFILSPRVAYFIAKGNLWHYNKEVADSLMMFPEWNTKYEEDNLLCYYTKLLYLSRKDVRKESQWSSVNNALLWQHLSPRMKLKFVNDIPSISLEINGIYEDLLVCKNHKGKANSIISNVECEHVENTKYRIVFKRNNRTYSGYCKSISVQKSDKGEYFAQLSITFTNLPAAFPYNQTKVSELKASKGLPAANYGKLQHTVIHYQKANLTNESNPEIKVMGIDLGVNRLASYAISDGKCGIIVFVLYNIPKRTLLHYFYLKPGAL